MSRSGFAVTVGIACVGGLLQLCIGNINWDLVASPVNVVILAVYVALLIIASILLGFRFQVSGFRFQAQSRNTCLNSFNSLTPLTPNVSGFRFLVSRFRFQAQSRNTRLNSFNSLTPLTPNVSGFRFQVYRRQTKVMRWITSADAAVPALLLTGIATVVYGITCIRETLSFWPFVMLYAWLATIAGLVAIDAVVRLCRGVPNSFDKLRTSLSGMIRLAVHLGFFIAVVCATLGNADMRRVTMEVANEIQRPTAIEPMGIRLNRFTLEEYEAKLAVVSNKSGEVVSDDLSKWGIKVLRTYDFAAKDDGGGYAEWKHEGATTAALVSIKGRGQEWVSNGSFMFAPESIALDEDHTLVMPERKPKRFVADVSIFTHGDEHLADAEIEVNKPYKTDGWNIYLTGYDRQMGRWSNTCVVEFIKDPWLTYVYIGIFLLLAGAFLIIVRSLLPSSSKEVQGSKFKVAYPQPLPKGRGEKEQSQSIRLNSSNSLTPLTPERVQGSSKNGGEMFKGQSSRVALVILACVVICACVFCPVMTAKAPVPALQSPWFIPHIIMYMFCYAFLGAATLLSLLPTFPRRGGERVQSSKFKVQGSLPPTPPEGKGAKFKVVGELVEPQGSRFKVSGSTIDLLVYVGLSLMTIGMLFGALWAKDAWGHYWAWDPKETWAAATWFLYLTYIHVFKVQGSRKPTPDPSRREGSKVQSSSKNGGEMLQKNPSRWKGVVAVCLLVLAFCCLQMCWWGINYLPAAQEISVHTY